MENEELARRTVKQDRQVVAVGIAIIVGIGLGLGFGLKPNNTGWFRVSDIMGWTYFAAWSVSFYPQTYLNWKRKSVIGLSFDYTCYNMIGFTCYSIFNCAFFWSSSIQKAYEAAHGGKKNLVQVNDVFFALHAVVLTFIQVIQICIYERGSQRLSRFCVFWSTAMVLGCVLYPILILSGVSAFGVFVWLDYLYYLSYIKLAVTLCKYPAQVYLNYSRQSTTGWNIWNVLLDFTGGCLSLAQLCLDGSITNDWSGVTGDPVKFGLGSSSVVFDVVFMVQHYCLYTDRFDPFDPATHTRAAIRRASHTAAAGGRSSFDEAASAAAAEGPASTALLSPLDTPCSEEPTLAVLA